MNQKANIAAPRAAPATPSPSVDDVVDRFNKGVGIAMEFTPIQEGGYVKDVYKDSKGNLTIGHGHRFIKDPKTGKLRKVQEGDVLSEKDSLALMQEKLREAAVRIRHNVPRAEEMTPQQIASLIDIDYNQGGSWLTAKKSPNLFAALSAPGADINEVLSKQVPTYGWSDKAIRARRMRAVSLLIKPHMAPPKYVAQGTPTSRSAPTVKQASEDDDEDEKLKNARDFVRAVRRMALRRKLNYFVVTDGASGVGNNGNPAVRNAREAQIKWELEHGSNPYEDWSGKDGADSIVSMARRHYPESGSHGWNHIKDVMASAEKMLGRKLTKKELAAIVYHDSSLMTGSRETHAEDSAAIAERELSAYFKKKAIRDIANAIRRHRASYEGKRVSKLENLVAAADRNPPDVEKDILRSFKYGIEHGMGIDGAIANTLQHMPDKYGTKGYAYKNVPKIYLDTYGKELRKAQEAFDNVSEDRIRRIAEAKGLIPGPAIKQASKKDTHGEDGEEWTGFDLDGTLATYDEWKGIDHIGKPIKPMVNLIKKLHREGKPVKIVTARVAPKTFEDGGKGIDFVEDKNGKKKYAFEFIADWCKKNLGFTPPIVHEKDHCMGELYDDRAKQVEQNTGRVLEDSLKEARTCIKGLLKVIGKMAN